MCLKEEQLAVSELAEILDKNEKAVKKRYPELLIN
jgi:DNA-directed RNA polymerase specialized sigma24 family protein